MREVGFMQGRLSAKPADRIQAFPKDSWREEFERGNQLKFDCIELIYDELYLEENPLSSSAGRKELKALSLQSRVKLASICADYFMVQPLEKNQGKAIELLEISKEIGCPLVEFPFVDSSSLAQRKDHTAVVEVLCRLSEEAERSGITLAVETDLPPLEFRAFLKKLPKNIGANLDLGNSAALGFDAIAECRAFGDRIFNVHIKDRILGGTTVPLTTGHTDFDRAFRGLAEAEYNRDFILQTAPSEDYLGVATKYRQMVLDWIKLL